MSPPEQLLQTEHGISTQNPDYCLPATSHPAPTGCDSEMGGRTWFHVSMEVAVVVHELQALQDLVAPHLDLGLLKGLAMSLLHHLVEVEVLQPNRQPHLC